MPPAPCRPAGLSLTPPCHGGALAFWPERSRPLARRGGGHRGSVAGLTRLAITIPLYRRPATGCELTGPQPRSLTGQPHVQRPPGWAMLRPRRVRIGVEVYRPGATGNQGSSLACSLCNRGPRPSRLSARNCPGGSHRGWRSEHRIDLTRRRRKAAMRHAAGGLPEPRRCGSRLPAGGRPAPGHGRRQDRWRVAGEPCPGTVDGRSGASERAIGRDSGK